MESPGLHRRGPQLAEPLAHFGGCANSESYGEYALRAIHARGYPIRDSVCNGASFTGACTSNDAHWPPKCFGDLALFGIESVEQLFSGGGHGLLRNDMAKWKVTDLAYLEPLTS